MKTGALIAGVLLLGVLLWYALFLLTTPDDRTNPVFDSQSYNSNGAFQNALLPAQPSSSKWSSPFKTQSFVDKHTVIE